MNVHVIIYLILLVIIFIIILLLFVTGLLSQGSLQCSTIDTKVSCSAALKVLHQINLRQQNNIFCVTIILQT